jgi:Transposase DDE domain group 1
LQVKPSRRRQRLRVTSDGHGVVSHGGTRLLGDLAEQSGLADDLSGALAPVVKANRRHAPGDVLVDLAVMLADGGECTSDLKVLRDQPSLFGPVASQPTAWRLLGAIDESLLGALQAARAPSRARAWAVGLAPAKLTLDFDASLVELHSEKELAAPTYKKGFGYHPLFAFLDETGEALAAKLRPGSDGANTAADHIELLDAAIAQLPVTTKATDPENGANVLVRADTAGATHGFVNAIVANHFEFSIGFDVTEAVRRAISGVPEGAWQEPMGQDMGPREGAGVAELTPYLDLSAWPEGTRAIVRREEPHVGAQFNLFDPDGWRHQVFITSSAEDDIVYLEARHRGHARVEDRIKKAKDLGLLRFPAHSFAANAAWLLVVLCALDLIAWAQGLCFVGELAHCEPKRLRYCVWHVGGRLVRTGRRLILRIDASWPWATELAGAFERLHHLAFNT